MRLTGPITITIDGEPVRTIDPIPREPLSVTGTMKVEDMARFRQWAEELERWPTDYIPAGDIIEGGPVFG